LCVRGEEIETVIESIDNPGRPYRVKGVPDQAVAATAPAAFTPAARPSASLTLGAWTNSPSGWTNPVTVPATLPVKFYRLLKP
jgi:hypothetical protein